MRPAIDAATTWLQSLVGLAERYPGTGGWVGAIGAILAIIGTWFVSRTEYRRTLRQALAERREAVRLMGAIVDDLEAVIAPLADAARLGSVASMGRSDAADLNNPQWNAFLDLARMPVTGWPNLRTYAAFKRYWSSSVRLRDTTMNPVTPSLLPGMVSERDAALTDLRAALKAFGS